SFATATSVNVSSLRAGRIGSRRTGLGARAVLGTFTVAYGVGMPSDGIGSLLKVDNTRGLPALPAGGHTLTMKGVLARAIWPSHAHRAASAARVFAGISRPANASRPRLCSCAPARVYATSSPLAGDGGVRKFELRRLSGPQLRERTPRLRAPFSCWRPRRWPLCASRGGGRDRPRPVS